MSCNRYREMLHLYRPGELGEAELRELESHLRTCADCSALKSRIAKAEQTLGRMREFVAAPPDIDRALENIGRAVGEPSGRSRVTLTPSLLDRFLSRLELPALQWAGAMVAIILTGAFLFQQVSTLNDVSDLEARLATTGTPRTKLQLAYVLPSVPEKASREYGRLLQAADGRLARDAKGRMTISQADAAEIQDAALTRLLYLIGPQKTLNLDTKTIDEMTSYIARNTSVVLRTTTRGDMR